MIKESPNVHHPSYKVYDESKELNLAIGYNPNQRGMTGKYPYYKYITHLTKNRLYEELHNKAWKLKESKFAGPLAVILCDGGYSPFYADPNWNSYSVKEVIDRFLSDHPCISFVLLFKLKQHFGHNRPPNQVLTELYKGVEFDLISNGILDIISKITSVMPTPERDGFNAINHLKSRRPQEGASFMGGLAISYSDDRLTVKISARTILQLLAGEITQEDFFEVYGFVPTNFLKNPQIANPFESQLKKGNVIVDVGFEKTKSEEDDDWIVFTLKGPDPAISKFKLSTLDKRQKAKGVS